MQKKHTQKHKTNHTDPRLVNQYMYNIPKHQAADGAIFSIQMSKCLDCTVNNWEKRKIDKRKSLSKVMHEMWHIQYAYLSNILNPNVQVSWLHGK